MCPIHAPLIFIFLFKTRPKFKAQYGNLYGEGRLTGKNKVLIQFYALSETYVEAKSIK